jgi:hypothetical protein
MLERTVRTEESGRGAAAAEDACVVFPAHLAGLVA